jgi:hypothetical protein
MTKGFGPFIGRRRVISRGAPAPLPRSFPFAFDYMAPMEGTGLKLS